jgi:hypothetical protein
MAFLVLIFATIMMGIGTYGIASPPGVVSFARRWQGQVGVWVAAGSRILLGIALWSAAPSSRTPGVFEVLGAISLLSGIALPFIGAERLSRIIAWWSGQPSSLIRGWCSVGLAAGLFLFWSVVAR